MLSMTVMKANIRRPAELVFMGAKGKNTSQVPFPSNPIERSTTHIQLSMMQLTKILPKQPDKESSILWRLTVKLRGGPQAVWIQVMLNKYEQDDNDEQEDT